MRVDARGPAADSIRGRVLRDPDGEVVTVSYRGNLTVAGAIPGLSAALTTVGTALSNLKITCEAQFSALLDASASISAQANAVLAAKAAIRIPATADIQAQLDASLAIGAQLTADVGDPALIRMAAF